LASPRFHSTVITGGTKAGGAGVAAGAGWACGGTTGWILDAPIGSV
jgi:hypothetical protein